VLLEAKGGAPPGGLPHAWGGGWPPTVTMAHRSFDVEQQFQCHTKMIKASLNARKMEAKRRNENLYKMLVFMPLVFRNRGKERRRKLSF
jgi:hypothetical protein